MRLAHNNSAYKYESRQRLHLRILFVETGWYQYIHNVIITVCFQTPDGEQSNINDDDRIAVRSMIVGLLLDTDVTLEKQLSEVVTLIGRYDFPNKWPELLPTLTTELASNDMKRVVSCLRTAHLLFKRYRHETKSNELWTELKQVLDQFAAPLTALFSRVATQTIAIANQSSGDVDRQQLDMSVHALVLMTKVFHSLNAQDLPEYFEVCVFFFDKHLIFSGQHEHLDAGTARTIKA